MSMARFRSPAIWLAVLLLVIATAPQVMARTVICISGPNTDRYLNNAEGYYRQYYPGATIQRGGNLTDCLNQVAAGDTLIIVAHGAPGLFNWNGTQYAGFSGGRGATGTGVGGGLQPFPLPANFNAPGINVRATVEMCFSSTAPEGGKSVATSLQDGLANGAPAVVGSPGQSETFRGDYTLQGGTAAQQAAAQACLQAAAVAADANNTNDKAGVRRWLAGVPPANSPSNPNAQTVANNTINATNCPGAGGAVTIRFTYNCVPIDPFLATEQKQCSPDEGDIACESGPVPVVHTSWGKLKDLYH